MVDPERLILRMAGVSSGAQESSSSTDTTDLGLELLAHVPDLL